VQWIDDVFSIEANDRHATRFVNMKEVF